MKIDGELTAAAVACLEPTDVEIVVIEVFVPSTPWGQQKSSWIVACCYRPPSAGIDKVFLEQFKKLASSTVRYKALFVGDFKMRRIHPGGLVILPWTKKRTILEIRGEKNAVPRVISCSIRHDQRRAKVADSRGSDLPCADRA